MYIATHFPHVRVRPGRTRPIDPLETEAPSLP